jgi:DNA repair protein RadA/Sms
MKELFSCIECGFETPKWMGKCTNCGKWGTLKLVDKSSGVTKTKRAPVVKVENISGKTQTAHTSRMSTGFKEIDRVLGGGLVKGEVLLLGGHPGVGKTTLLLQILNKIQTKNGIYVSGEESSEQLSVHAKRLQLDGRFSFISSNNIDAIIETIKEVKSPVIVIDSIQTVATTDLNSIAGGVGQVKECTSRLIQFAKKTGTVILIVGHINKGGDIAGPKVIEHLVDGVFYIEGDSSSKIRIIRSIKNRFGSTREVGVFEFGEKGYSDARNPSEIFVLTKDPQIGVCKGVVFEGRRALIVEIQALVTNSVFNIPQRVVSGLKKVKVQMISALLTKHAKSNLLDKDIYVNVANGLKVDDSSVDLSVAVAILSSLLNKKIDDNRVAIGELSLTGKVHTGSNINEKLKTLKELGYKKLILPKSVKTPSSKGNQVLVDTISDLSGKI